MATEAKTTAVEKMTDKPAEIIKDEKAEDIKPVEVTMKLKSINVKLPEEIHRKLKAKVAMEGENTGNVLKRLVDEYLKEK